MYSDNKTVQIVISLLKEFGVRHVVLSPGGRNVPVVHSLEQDPYFNCYSIVDERSAAYFALGLAIETAEPVLISCTSGTAPTNYTSAMWEASRQKIPLIALTSDRHQYYYGQLEDQMINQPGMYGDACRASVSLPIVNDEEDAWYCARLVNEALLATQHREGGPVQINLPTKWGLFAQNFNTAKLPKCKVIKRLSLARPEELREKVRELKSKKRILVMYGQSRQASALLEENIKGFAAKYACAISTETLSNLSNENSINTSLICRALNKETIREFAPDLVISVQGDYVSPIKGHLKGPVEFDHWVVNEDGAVVDQFKKLTTIFEGSAEDFFAFFNAEGGEPIKDHAYLRLWQSQIASLPKPEFPYSSAYAMQEFMKRLQPDSILHLGNGVSVHMNQYFPSPPGILTYCHSGTTTIDGSLSSFIGQASASNRLCYAFIGDLSFFYDMNGLWNRYVGKNVRILLYNNEGGQTFHWNAAKEIETLPLHTSAEHFTTARGWVESIGMRYCSAGNKEEFDQSLSTFMSADSDQPIFFEVFTKKDTDGRILHKYYDDCRRKLEADWSAKIKPELECVESY